MVVLPDPPGVNRPCREGQLTPTAAPSAGAGTPRVANRPCRGGQSTGLTTRPDAAAALRIVSDIGMVRSAIGCPDAS